MVFWVGARQAGHRCEHLDDAPFSEGKNPIFYFNLRSFRSNDLNSVLLQPVKSGPARALLRFSAEDLAQRSAVGVATIRRAEVSEDKTSLTIPNDSAIQKSLEAAGVEFIDENGGGPDQCWDPPRARPQPKSTYHEHSQHRRP